MPAAATDASSLLAVPTDRPDLVFPADREGIRHAWRRLGGAWHPDRSADPLAGRVFAHLESLHRAALERLAGGLWDDGRSLDISTLDGSRFRFRYRSRLETDLGPCFVGDGHLAYRLPGARHHLARRGFDRIRRLPHADRGMREATARCLPEPRRLLRTRDHVLVVLGKTPDLVALPDLQHHLGGSIPPRHLAWIVSGLLHIGCYLEWAGLCHLAIAPDQCLVSPRCHTVNLAGGWWFATPSGARLDCLPARSADLAAPDVLHRRVADRRLDALLIRRSALDLLGEAAREAPPPMLEYLTLPGTGSAVCDYVDWQRALHASFGERRFAELAVSPDDVHGAASRDRRRGH